MTYDEAVSYIESVPKFTKKNEASNTVELIERLGRPERNMKIIHVAGTNGKGSVCAFLSSMLVEGGKKTGLFTSPHLIKINERFQIDHVPVSDEEFLLAWEKLRTVIGEMQRDGFFHPTYFEILFALGLIIFQRQEVEYLVLETGLGGRLDATNVIEHPLAVVLTSISLDHTEILGDTIEQIAWEKAGIIKEGVPVIYDGHDGAAEKVILEKAAQMHARAIGLHPDMYEITERTHSGIAFRLNAGVYEQEEFTVPFPAGYQAANASLALLAMEEVDSEHFTSLDLRRDALSHARWQGRMEMVLPGVIVDGAHNADGIREFAKTLSAVPEGQRIVLLFSAVVEKNYEKMIETICSTGRLSEIIVTEIHGSRIVPAETLADVFRKYTSVPVTAYEEMEKAFDCALEKRSGGTLYCAGSLYLVGEIKEIIEEKYK